MDSKSASLPRRHLRLGLACLLALVLAACSTLRLGYNHVDTMLAWSLDSYLDLDSSQQALVKERSARLLAWHRQTQLPEYSRWLAAARGELGRPVSVAEVSEFQQRLRGSMLALGEEAAPDLAALALSLRPGQLQHLRDRLAREQRKARRELESAGPEAQFKQSVERVEDWFGPLSREQRATLAKLHAGLPPEPGVWLEERERRSNELLALLERVVSQKPAAGEVERDFRALFSAWTTPSDPARRALSERWRQHNAEVITVLLQQASPAQRAHLARRLADYEEDFSQLAAQSGPRRG